MLEPDLRGRKARQGRTRYENWGDEGGKNSRLGIQVKEREGHGLVSGFGN